MEDRLDQLEDLILAKNTETMDRFDRILDLVAEVGDGRTHNTEDIRELQEDNSDTKSGFRSHMQAADKAVDRLDIVWESLNAQTRMINKRLAKLEFGEFNLKSRIQDLENRELAKQTERSAKKEGSTWNKVKKGLGVSKDELAHTYIVD